MTKPDYRPFPCHPLENQNKYLMFFPLITIIMILCNSEWKISIFFIIVIITQLDYFNNLIFLFSLLSLNTLFSPYQPVILLNHKLCPMSLLVKQHVSSSHPSAANPVKVSDSTQDEDQSPTLPVSPSPALLPFSTRSHYAPCWFNMSVLLAQNHK